MSGGEGNLLCVLFNLKQKLTKITTGQRLPQYIYTHTHTYIYNKTEFSFFETISS